MRELMTQATPSAKTLTSTAADSPASVRIVTDAGEQAQDATKAFADACWRRNLRISPDSWRLNHGYTVAKMWLDGRGTLAADWQAAHAEGVNGMVLDETTWPLWQAQVSDRAAWMAVVVTEAVTPAACAGADMAVVPVATLDEEALMALERLVQAGQLAGYGVMLHAAGTVDLQEMLERAKSAAQAVWGRRKRPALRALLLPFGLGHEQALRVACCRDGEELISQLEWAARRDVMVLAMAGGAAYGPDGARLEETAPVDAAEMVQVAGLVLQAAQAEQALAAALGGWPQRDGSQVFSVVSHLQQDVPLWPGASVWQRWRQAVWPDLQVLWRQVAELQTAVRPLVDLYMVALQELDAAGATVARMGGMAWQVRELARVAQHGVTAAPGQAAVARAQVVASVAGISGVVGAWTAEEVRTGMQRPGIADVAPLLGV